MSPEGDAYLAEFNRRSYEAWKDYRHDCTFDDPTCLRCSIGAPREAPLKKRWWRRGV